MSPKETALRILKERGDVTSQTLAAQLGVSRVYAQRILHELVQEGQIRQVGRTRGTRYVGADAATAERVRAERRSVVLHLRNRDLSEDQVFDRIDRETGILLDVPKNVRGLFAYGFTEMLNNAIDHSRSERIDVEVRRSDTALTFVVRDHGIGIFNNVRDTFRLPGTLAAIQELLKGKRTTDPARHSGQGVFFTSKMADVFIVDSFEKTLTINNLIKDVFITDRKMLRGTRVSFSVRVTSMKQTKDVFAAFTGTADEDSGFDRSRVTIKLFDYGTEFPSRSEARRVMTNLENFKAVELDFKGVETIGQGFADQIFRVWQGKHPDIRLIAINANENVAFMIKAGGGDIGQDTLKL